MPIKLPVAEESAEATWVKVVEYSNEELLVELEGAGELLGDLPHAVDELHEHRWSVRVRVVLVSVSDSLLNKPSRFNNCSQ